MNCSRCGVSGGLLSSLSIGKFTCPDCERELFKAQSQARTPSQEEKERIEALKQRAQAVLLTTTPKVDGHYVAKYIGIESVEFVIGTGVFSEVSSSIADFFARVVGV